MTIEHQERIKACHAGKILKIQDKQEPFVAENVFPERILSGTQIDPAKVEKYQTAAKQYRNPIPELQCHLDTILNFFRVMPSLALEYRKFSRSM